MKKILSLVSVLTIGVAPILTLNATSLYDVKNNFEGTDFKANLESSQQAKKIVKRETEIHQKKSNFVKDSELATPITKVTAFYINNSDKNTFIWSKKLPTGTKYNFFNVEIKENSNYWVEGYEFNYFNRRVYSPLGYVVNMSLINNKEDEKTLAEETYSS
ncbi:hypothetical protein [Spiroplasma endosymbiont of Sarcophaga variegata]|uniref:hypothetical protein n=1 Tax=Spiroplasma endosymbiont of Sarcophaga variegata TaxID=3066304 RepID=UPI003AF84F61